MVKKMQNQKLTGEVMDLIEGVVLVVRNIYI